MDRILNEIRAKLESVAPVTEEKDVNYGHQFTVVRGKEKAVLTVYEGKKGRSFVWGGSSDALKNDLMASVENETPADKRFKGMWAGSDESGKGDFFGPLVIAAVIVDEEAAEELATAGVKDCKKLTDKKILELEPLILEKVIDSCVLNLYPAVYNIRYRELTAVGENLNNLLGYGHVAALTNILEKRHMCSGALIDQFTTSTRVLDSLKAAFPHMEFKQMPGAECDMAVAAASVLARAKFLRVMAKLAVMAGVGEIPKGGGDAATECAKEIAKRLGKDALQNFVKLHFANYTRI